MTVQHCHRNSALDLNLAGTAIRSQAGSHKVKTHRREPVSAIAEPNRA